MTDPKEIAETSVLQFPQADDDNALEADLNASIDKHFSDSEIRPFKYYTIRDLPKNILGNVIRKRMSAKNLNEKFFGYLLNGMMASKMGTTALSRGILGDTLKLCGHPSRKNVNYEEMDAFLAKCVERSIGATTNKMFKTIRPSVPSKGLAAIVTFADPTWIAAFKKHIGAQEYDDQMASVLAVYDAKANKTMPLPGQTPNQKAVPIAPNPLEIPKVPSKVSSTTHTPRHTPTPNDVDGGATPSSVREGEDGKLQLSPFDEIISSLDLDSHLTKEHLFKLCFYATSSALVDHTPSLPVDSIKRSSDFRCLDDYDDAVYNQHKQIIKSAVLEKLKAFYTPFIPPQTIPL